MGQPVTVVEKPTAVPGVVRFELNRSLSGMDHEVYEAGRPVRGHRPVDEAARRLLEHGGVERVSINSSVITVLMAHGRGSEGLKEILEELFTFYRDGVVPEDPAAPA